jgi:hypothetical protein
MQDLEHALADIHLIRHQVARGTQFRGYGPGSIAVTGLAALAVAWGESLWAGHGSHDLAVNLMIWLSTATASLLLSGIDTWRRARRVHVDLAEEMLQAAAEQFIPALAVGALLTVVLVRVAPGEGWLLPGLWEIIFSLGIFASCRFLPRPMFAVGLWYLAAGLCSLVVGSGPKVFLPWTMGVPFGAGQLLVAAVLKICVDQNSEGA